MPPLSILLRRLFHSGVALFLWVGVILCLPAAAQDPTLANTIVYQTEVQEAQKLLDHFDIMLKSGPKSRIEATAFEISQNIAARALLKNKDYMKKYPGMAEAYHDIWYGTIDPQTNKPKGGLLENILNKTKKKMNEAGKPVKITLEVDGKTVEKELLSIRNITPDDPKRPPMDFDVGFKTDSREEAVALLHKLGGPGAVDNYHKHLQQALEEAYQEAANDVKKGLKVDPKKAIITGATAWHPEAYGDPDALIKGKAPGKALIQQTADVTRWKVLELMDKVRKKQFSLGAAYIETVRGTLKDLEKVQAVFDAVQKLHGVKVGWTKTDLEIIQEMQKLAGVVDSEGTLINPFTVNKKIMQLSGGKDIFQVCQGMADKMEGAWKLAPSPPRDLLKKFLAQYLDEPDLTKANKAIDSGNLKDLPDKAKTLHKELQGAASARLLNLEQKAPQAFLADLKKRFPDLNLKGDDEVARQVLNQLDNFTDDALAELFGREAGQWMVELRGKVTAGVRQKMALKLSNHRLSLGEADNNLWHILRHKKYGTEGAWIEMDALMGTAMALFQTSMIMDQGLSPEEESRAIHEAWIGSLPVIGDFFQSFIEAAEFVGGLEYEARLEPGVKSALWFCIGSSTFVPGLQPFSLIAGLGMMGWDLGVVSWTTYRATSQDRQLIQTWVDSGDWDEDKGLLKGLRDVQNQVRSLDKLVDQGDVGYLKGLEGTTMRGSIYAFVVRNQQDHQRKMESFRKVIKQHYPDFDLDAALQESYEHGRTLLAAKIGEHGGNPRRNLAMALFRKMHQEYAKAAQEAVPVLKAAAEAEYQASHFVGDVKDLDKKLEALGKRLGLPLLQNVHEIIKSFSHMLAEMGKTPWVRESLKVRQVELKKKYLQGYLHIEDTLKRLTHVIRQAGLTPPYRWNLAGFLEIDAPRVAGLEEAYLVGALGQARQDAAAIRAEVAKQPGYAFNPKSPCDSDLFKKLAQARISLVHSRDMLLLTDQWAGKVSAAEQSRDEVLRKAQDAARDRSLFLKAYGGLCDSYESAYSWSKKKWEGSEVLTDARENIASRVRVREKQYETLKSEGKEEMLLCLDRQLPQAIIDLSESRPRLDQQVTARLVIKEGKAPAGAAWHWRVTGGLKLDKAAADHAVVTVPGDGQVIAGLVLDGKTLREYGAKVTLAALDLDSHLTLSDAKPRLNQEVTAAIVIKRGKAPQGARWEWRGVGGLRLVRGAGERAIFAAQDDGQVMATLVQDGKTLVRHTAPVRVRPPDLVSIGQLPGTAPPPPTVMPPVTPPPEPTDKGAGPPTPDKATPPTMEPPVTDIKVAGTGDLRFDLVVSNPHPIMGETIEARIVPPPAFEVTKNWQAGGPLKISGADFMSEVKVKAVQPGEGELRVTLKDNQNKVVGTAAAKITVAPKLSVGLKAPGEVGATEIFKVVADIPAGISQNRKIEYFWKIDDGAGRFLNVNNQPSFGVSTTPEAVCQPEYLNNVKRGISTLDISLTVNGSDRGGAYVLGEGKTRVRLIPESFSARAPDSWKGEADNYGVRFNYGKTEKDARGSIMANFGGQISVKVGEVRAILPPDAGPDDIDYGTPKKVAAKGVKFSLGDFHGSLEEKPLGPNTGGVASVKGLVSKGRISITIEGRLQYSGVAAAAQQRMATLYREMLDIIKSVRLGTGRGIAYYPAGKPPPLAADQQIEKEKDRKPLAVKLKAAKTKVVVGEQVAVEAVVENATPEDQPLTYAWSGNYAGQGAKVEFVGAQPGKHILQVSVKGGRDRTSSGKIEFDVSGLKAEIVKLSPPGNTIPVGGTATFKVKFTGAPGQSYIYRWQPHPEADWKPFEGPSDRAAATFKRPGAAKVWVTVLEKKGTALTTVAQSDTVILEVVKPQMKLTFSPASAYIGQEVKAKVDLDPLPPDLSLRWMPLPTNARQISESQDSREITFIPKDDRPIQVKALALVKHHGDTLGEAAGTFKAQQYQVTAKVVGPLGPAPMVWSSKPGEGLVPAPKAIAIHQNVRVKAEVSPAPAQGPARYRWSVNEDSHIQQGQHTAEIMVNRSQVGSCMVTVLVEDSQGAQLGTAQTSFQVTVDQGLISKELREAALKKAAEGKLDEAIELAENALKLDPATKANNELVNRLKSEKEVVLKQVEKTKKAISQADFPQAEKDLTEAKKLHPKYPPVVEAEKLLAAARDKNRQQAGAKLAQAKGLAGQGRLDEAIKLAQEAIQLDRDNPEAPKLIKEWQALKDQVAKLQEEGKGLEKQGKLAEAIGKYQQSLKYLPDPKLEEHIKTLQAKLDKEKANKQMAGDLRNQGAALQNQNKLAEAIAKYQQSLKYLPDPKLEEHIKTLQAKLNQSKQDQDKYAKAKDLRNQGIALQNQGRLPEAIAKYQESLKYFPDPKLEAIIRSLQAEVAKEKEKALATKVTPAQGQYAGSISGPASGTIKFSIKGNSLTGSIDGTYYYELGGKRLKAPFNGKIKGSVNQNAQMSGILSGTVGKVNFQGTIDGRIHGKTASGSWLAKGVTTDKGSWQAKLGDDKARQDAHRSLQDAVRGVRKGMNSYFNSVPKPGGYR